MENKIHIIGSVDNFGNPKMANTSSFREFMSKNKGRQFSMSISIMDESPSTLALGYYFNKVVKDYQKIFRDQQGEFMTLSQTDEKLREESPFMLVEEPVEEMGGFVVTLVLTAYKVSSKQLNKHIEYCRNIAARDYGVVIEDPRK